MRAHVLYFALVEHDDAVHVANSHRGVMVYYLFLFLLFHLTSISISVPSLSGI